MIDCYHRGKEVTQKDEQGYEVYVSRWTMDMPKVKEYFHYHEDCWSEKFKNPHGTPPDSMERMFGDFIEPHK